MASRISQMRNGPLPQQQTPLNNSIAQVRQLMAMVQNSPNQQAALVQILQNNPNTSAIANMLKNNGNLESIARQMAQERGYNIDEIISQLV